MLHSSTSHADVQTLAETATARLHTVLILDYVASTELTRTLGDREAARVYSSADRELRNHIARCQGREIDKSDGFLILFDRPIDAVKYALVAHGILEQLALKLEMPARRLRCRIGIHVGELILVANSPEHILSGAKQIEAEGLAKLTTSRLMSLAQGGQTLLSRTAFDLARRGAIGHSDVPEAIQWLAHGPYIYAGVDEPQEVYEVGVAGKAPLAAPPDSEKARRAIAVGDETVLGWRPAVGQRVPNRTNFVLTEKIGEGGFGEVWLARRVRSSESRVFKFCFQIERVRALKREVALFTVLKESLGERDDIAKVLDWQFEEAPYYLELEYTDGGDLSTWAQSKGGIDKVPLSTRLSIIRQVAEALSAAHSVGVLHKDVKPSNILITEKAPGIVRARLTDFGIGLLTDRQHLVSMGLTATGLTDIMHSGSTAFGLSGTRMYLAPEILEGRPATPLSDVFALGVLFYQVVAGSLNRALAPGWERDIEDTILVQDIAKCLDRVPHTRLPADQLAWRIASLEERRERNEADEFARQEIERLRIEAAANKNTRRTYQAAAIAGLMLIAIVTALSFRIEKQRKQAEKLLTTSVLDENFADSKRKESETEQYFEAVALAELSAQHRPTPKVIDALLATTPALRNWEWGYAMHCVNQDLFSFPTGSQFPLQVSMSPDSALAVVSSWTGHAGSFAGGEASVFDVDTGKLKFTLNGHTDAVICSKFSPGGEYIATASWDNTWKLWNAQTGALIVTGEGHTGQLRAIAWSPDASVIATGSQDNTTRLWNPETGAELVKLAGHTQPVYGVSFNPDGTRLASCSLDSTVRIWDGHSSVAIAVLQDWQSPLRSIAWSPAGRFIAAGCFDGTILLYDLDDETSRPRILRGHQRDVTSLIFSATSHCLISGSMDNTIRSWDTATGNLERVYPVMGDVLQSVSAGDKPEILASVQANKQLSIWPHPESDRPKRLSSRQGINGFNPRNYAQVYSVTGHWYGDPDAKWRTPAGSTWCKHGSTVFRIDSAQATVSPTGDYIVFTDDDAATTARVLDNNTGKLTEIEHQPRFHQVRSEFAVRTSFSADNRWFAGSASGQYGAVVYDTKTWKLSQFILIEDGEVHFAKFAPRENYLAIGSGDHVHVWDIDKKRELATIKGHSNSVLDAAFSPDGKYLAIASFDQTVSIWDWQTQKLVARCIGFQDFVASVSFSPDGSRLLAVSGDRTGKLFDSGSGREVLTLDNFKGKLVAAAFTQDGRSIFGATSDGEPHVWEALPWKEQDYPNGSDSSYAAKLSEYKRRAFTANFQ